MCNFSFCILAVLYVEAYEAGTISTKTFTMNIATAVYTKHLEEIQ